MSAPISVLIVDDSITARSLMLLALKKNPKISVVGTAATAFEARDLIMALKPDVITLDVEMPQMNGLEFLEKIMTLRPMPVVMVSSHTRRGADTAIRALELGAVECYAKPKAEIGRPLYEDLAIVIQRAARAHIRQKKRIGASSPFNSVLHHDKAHCLPLIGLGSSTGGVEALSEVLRRFPENCPPTVITQHLPGTFSEGFAKRLNHLCAPNVRLAEHLMPIKSGEVVIAPGGSYHLQVVRRNGRIISKLVEKPPVNGHRPSVDVLFDSIAQNFGAHAIGAILTGMGDDGARGLLNMREAGAYTVGQDEGSCVVYGMPKVAFEIGAVMNQAPLSDIANILLKQANHLAHSFEERVPL